MKAPAPAIVASVPLGIASAFVVPMHAWETMRGGLLPALSVIAGAVLVRLARGFPFTNADRFTLNQFRRTADSLKDVAYKLRTMMFVCLSGMAGLVIFPPFLDYMDRGSLPAVVLCCIQGTMSGLLAAATVYAFVRMMEVTQIDLTLLKLQAKLLEDFIAAKNAKAFEQEIEARPPGKIAGASAFGRPLQ